MATGDIRVLDAGAFGQQGSKVCNVAASATLIYPGEPVIRDVGGIVVYPMATNSPVVSSDYVAGIATTTSTNTSVSAGTVGVMPLVPGVIYGIKPNSAAAWDTQAEYDALVGKRVLIDLTTLKYTILASDSANNGCVVEALDIKRTPNTVAFSIRRAATDLV